MQGKIQMAHCKQINADQMEEDPGSEHQSVVNVSFRVIQILIRPFVGVRMYTKCSIQGSSGRRRPRRPGSLSPSFPS